MASMTATTATGDFYELIWRVPAPDVVTAVWCCALRAWRYATVARRQLTKDPLNTDLAVVSDTSVATRRWDDLAQVGTERLGSMRVGKRLIHGPRLRGFVEVPADQSHGDRIAFDGQPGRSPLTRWPAPFFWRGPGEGRTEANAFAFDG